VAVPLDQFEREQLRTPATVHIAALEVALRRGIAQIERMLPYMQWDGLEGEQDEINAHVTLDLMREALSN
jgi:hypothetical protein